ncbi:uncharacterized protein LOC132394504 [Hypanus sabinus]|uniref:uncharacterized protein LOC132394504 n=1 Tax=Hypanus sabinus TaxID=79690 RepID=UPI0028C39E76|nr:uncharacterized protein LOC132394504 [Hypanus sabinus]
MFYFIPVTIWFIYVNSSQGKNVTFYASPSSLVTFPGMDEKEVKITEVIHWEKMAERKGNVTSIEPFLQFHVGSKKPSLINKYLRRIDFSPSNGSLVFSNLTYADTGCYRLSINLRSSIIHYICLNIIDKLSKPSIWINGSSLHSTIQMSCNVDGDSPSYQWRKDGREVSQDQLLDGNKSLVIPSASRSDCGTYTCDVTNPVSSVQANYSLTIHGLPLVETSIVVTSIIGIVFSVVSFFGLLLLCFFRREGERGSLRQLKYLFLLLFICNTLSLLVISIALISWIAIKGAASASVVALFIVVALLPLNVCLTITIWNQGCQCFRKFLDCTGLRASIDFCGIVSSVIVIAISIVILIEEIQQSNQGCHVSYLTWSTVAPLIIVAAIIFFSFLIVWKRGSSSSSESNNEGTPQEQIRMNQLDQEPSENGGDQ